jgi:hypothetical protein
VRVSPRTLADVARQPARTKSKHCSICLAPEGWNGETSTLAKGICRDRAACESRHPPLPLEADDA